MNWAVLATWKMSLQGCEKAAALLKEGDTADIAAITGVNDVEDNPDFHSVGYGGRPDRTGHVTLDGGFMDGDTLHIGAVAGIEGFRSPVRIAYSLLKRDANNFLIGKGAEDYARTNGFEERDNLTSEAIEIYQKELEKEKWKHLEAYDGHDTVCFLTKDIRNHMVAATSTSGLFMKEPGRVGDSPLPGSGYYADSETGSAAATGMGEEIMKGSLSYAAVSLLKQGYTAQQAADTVVMNLDRELKKRNGHSQPMSLIVMDKSGNYGIGTNIAFTFTYASEVTPVALYEALPSEDGCVIHQIRE